jgi:hypothetical protein
MEVEFETQFEIPSPLSSLHCSLPVGEDSEDVARMHGSMLHMSGNAVL